MNIFLETESFLILLKYKELCESSIFVIEEDTLNIKKASSPIDISQGNIDLKTTHKQVVDIMEGGKEAFNKRQLIYTSWK